jgi:hypothetical protein
MLRFRGILAHYGTLLRDTPGHTWRAADVVSRFALLLVLVLFTFFGYRGDLPAELLIGLLVLVVIAALAVTEYDRYEAWKKDALFWRQQVRRSLDHDIAMNERQTAWNQLLQAVDEGRDDLYIPLRTTSAGAESDWVARIDRWDAETIARLERYWPSEVAFYSRVPDLVDNLPDARTRLHTIMDIKLNRLMTIYDRSVGLPDHAANSSGPSSHE